MRLKHTSGLLLGLQQRRSLHVAANVPREKRFSEREQSRRTPEQRESASETSTRTHKHEREHEHCIHSSRATWYSFFTTREEGRPSSLSPRRLAYTDGGKVPAPLAKAKARRGSSHACFTHPTPHTHPSVHSPTKGYPSSIFKKMRRVVVPLHRCAHPLKLFLFPPPRPFEITRGGDRAKGMDVLKSTTIHMWQ